MTRVALVWMVYSSTNSSEALGILFLFYTGPVVVGGLMAGWLLDCFDRRKVMMVDNVLRGIAVSSIPILNALNLLSLWEIYAVAFVYGLFYMITLAGSPSIVPDLVSQTELSTANSLETLAFTLSGVLGPPIAGLLILRIGPPNVMIIDTLSYASLVLALASVRLPPRNSLQGPRVVSAYRMKDAFRLLVSNRILLSTTLMFMIFNLGGGFLSVWLPVMVTRVLNGSSDLYGILLAALALGEVTGAFIGGSLVTSRLSLGRLICLSQSLAGASLALLLTSQVLWIAVPSLVLFGLFIAPLTIWAQTLRMRIIPERLRGRTFALLRTLMQSAGPTGSLIGGFTLPITGLLGGIAISTGLIGTPGLAGWGVRELGRTENLAGFQQTQDNANPALGKG